MSRRAGDGERERSLTGRRRSCGTRQAAVLGHELFLAFVPLRMQLDAFHRADHLALRLVMMADAFGAAVGIMT